MTDAPTIRAATDADAAGVIALVAAAYADYPGCILDVDNEEPELLAPASSHRAMGGGFWVAERDRCIVGSVGYRTLAGGGVELLKLYVDRQARRLGLGGRLAGLVEDEARRLGAGFIELWTDTRFVEAHRFYEARSYARGPTRALRDRSASVEYRYYLALA